MGIMKKMRGMAIGIVMIGVLATLSNSKVMASDTVKIAPENVLNVQVVDEEGNQVTDITGYLKNSAGSTIATFTLDGKWCQSNIVSMEETFNEPISTFAQLVSPDRLVQATVLDDDYTYVDKIPFLEDQKSTLLLETIPTKNEETTLKVPAGTFVTIIDPKWNSYYQSGVAINNKTYTFDGNAGKVIQYPLPAGTYQYWAVQSYNQCSGNQCMVTIADKTTEYTKKRVRLSDLSSYFNPDGTVNQDGIALNIGRNNQNKSAMLFFISGSVVTAAVPDSEGYVEIYVETSGRKYDYQSHFLWMDEDGEQHATSGIYGSFYAYEKRYITVEAVDFPETGATLSHVPAGEYTICLKDSEGKYETTSKNITIKESQDVQSIKFVVREKANYFYDENDNLLTNQFYFDGKYTYYLQADGSKMKDRLTYHPDGEHIIYFDKEGHEVFNQFVYCSSVGYTCYFDSNGYLYKDKITFVGDKVYYLNANGKMENEGWFQFANGVDYGYANWDGTLKCNGFDYDPWGRVVFYHWNGMVARGLITDGVWYYLMDYTDGHYIGSFPVM